MQVPAQGAIIFKFLALSSIVAQLHNFKDFPVTNTFMLFVFFKGTVVGNEKRGGSEGWQMFEDGFGEVPML
jgi:hypothetical protein